MSTVAQFNFLDGGERSTNNTGYYTPLGLTLSGGLNSFSIGSFASQSYFESSTITFGSANLNWAPPNFSSTNVYAGCRMFNTQWTGDMEFRDLSGNPQVTLSFNSNGSITASSGPTTLGTSNNYLIFLNTAFYLEVHSVIDPVNGSVEVRLNGNPDPIINVSNVNTEPYNTSSSPAITSVSFTCGANQTNWSFRDLYFHDGSGPEPFNDFLGDCGAVLCMPTANYGSPGFTPVGQSNNWQNAADLPPNSSNYNTSNIIGTTDSFTIAQLPTSVYKIIGTKLFSYDYKANSGSRALQKICNSGNASVGGTVNYENTTPIVTEDIYVTDPNTGNAWTITGHNSMKPSYTVAG